MGHFMFATWSRSLLLLAALGLVSACEEIVPPQEETPVVVAPVKKPVAAKPAPVVKKPATVDIDFGNDGGGGGGWQG